LLAAGISAALTIGRQEDPTITNIFATITTVFPGASALRVEALITDPLEAELREISEVNLIESRSATGVSVINIELQDTLDDNAIERVWPEVQNKLNELQPQLPPGALEPTLNIDTAGAYAAISILQSTSDTIPFAITQRYASVLADRLRAVSGTKLVDVFGDEPEEVLVEIDPNLLATLGLSIDQIASRLAAADAKVRAGRVRTSTNESLIEVAGEFDQLDRLANIPIVVGDTAATRLGDIATIIKGRRNPPSEYALVDGRPALLVSAKISDGLQVDKWLTDIRVALTQFDAELPQGIQQSLMFDQSQYTSDRLQGVALNMAIGMLLVVAVLFMTLGARSAVIVAIILPIVTLASLGTMNFFGIPIHQMSLTGLIVALGLLVDSAIVMTDEIRRRLANGVNRLHAVDHAVRRLFAPLLASTITTALSFMPMALLPGPPGDFVGAIAISVIIMLCWSFAIAMTITAAFAGRLIPATDVSRLAGENGQTKRPSYGLKFTQLGKIFRHSLRWSTRYPMSSVALALVLPIIGFLSLPTLTAQFFPGVDRDQFHVQVELPKGSAIAATRDLTARLDTLFSEDQRIEKVAWVIGKSAPAFYYNIVGNQDRAPAFAQALITTESDDATVELVPELQRSLNQQFPQARILVQPLVQGPPVDAPVELRVVGPNLDILRLLGNQLRLIASDVPDILIARTSLTGGSPKIELTIDEEQAQLAGFSLTALARQLDALLEGATGGSLLEGSEELPIRVRASDEIRGDLNKITNAPLVLPISDTIIPLSAVARASIVPASDLIGRRNGERFNSVQAFPQFGVLPEEALKKLRTRLEESDFELPAGYRLEIGGDSDARSDTLSNLIATLGLIITFSFATLVLALKSFRLAGVTCLVAALSAGLSLLAIAVFQYPLGITAIIGVIGSIGVSINAAIIIMTALQNDPDARRGDAQATVDVLANSSRHIVSTTLTTFGGFLPLIIAGGAFWPPFAMAIAGGVLLSTFVSFYFTPPMYRLITPPAAKTIVKRPIST